MEPKFYDKTAERIGKIIGYATLIVVFLVFLFAIGIGVVMLLALVV